MSSSIVSKTKQVLVLVAFIIYTQLIVVHTVSIKNTPKNVEKGKGGPTDAEETYTDPVRHKYHDNKSNKSVS